MRILKMAFNAIQWEIGYWAFDGHGDVRFFFEKIPITTASIPTTSCEGLAAIG